MRQVRWLTALVGAVVLLAGCGGDDEATTTTAAAPATETTAPAETTPAETTPAETTPAEAVEVSENSIERPDVDGDGTPDVQTFRGELGDTFTLVGQPTFKKASKEAAEVTMVEIVGPFSGFDLRPGNQLIGVTLRIKSVGEKPYKDPQPGGDLIAGGESGRQTSLITGTGENPCDNPSLKLDKGESATVCIAYEISKKARPQTFEFAMSSGYGDVGIWKLR